MILLTVEIIFLDELIVTTAIKNYSFDRFMYINIKSNAFCSKIFLSFPTSYPIRGYYFIIGGIFDDIMNG